MFFKAKRLKNEAVPYAYLIKLFMQVTSSNHNSNLTRRYMFSFVQLPQRKPDVVGSEDTFYYLD
jgi:hypothetical protein